MLVKTDSSMRVALVHDWLVSVRGGERVFTQICEAFPSADVFTFIYDKDRMPPVIRDRAVRSSFINWLPYSAHYKRVCFPLYPVAARLTDLTNYDLVVASSSAWAHRVRVGPQTVLVCYLYTPFRYIWSHYESLVAERVGPLRPLTDFARRRLQRSDLRAVARVDRFITLSQAVQTRIAKYYGRPSSVIMPPVDLEIYRPADDGHGDYFLIVSALMRYKRIDIAVEAFSQLGLPLKIVGSGEEEGRLRALARSNVEFLGQRPDDEVAGLYAGCKAFIFTSEEDFGIAPVEAMASGRPVLAYGAGGALETVVDGITGRFYYQQTSESLIDCVRSTDYSVFNPATIRAHALNFSPGAFRRKLRDDISALMAGPGRVREKQSPNRHDNSS